MNGFRRPGDNRLDFGGNPDHDPNTGLHEGSFIRQVEARVSGKVCTLRPVLDTDAKCTSIPSSSSSSSPLSFPATTAASRSCPGVEFWGQSL